MRKNNTPLTSGEEYTLRDLFQGERKIIIPDLQRDYCWGNRAWDKDKRSYTELVSGFVDSLLESFREGADKNLTLGLIYGYENPKHHIQLCDGQQRLTTLFLLLGMLNRKAQNNEFKSLLISDFELDEDDREPYLQYAIRESTLYFLSDLVCEFFVKNEIKAVEDIEKQGWYFIEYGLDASIQSIIAAIKIIEEKLPLETVAFGNFISEKLKFLYYDMGGRLRGEETFVVINTTGEPLTATENLKPIIIGNIKDAGERKLYSDQWESREEWFWKHKKGDDNTADDGLNDFFVRYWQIRLLQEKSWKNSKPSDLIPRELFLKKPGNNLNDEETPETERWDESVSLKTINSYFEALNKLIERCEQGDKIAKVLSTISESKVRWWSWFRAQDLDVTLPLMAYLEKFKEGALFYEFVRRIRKNHFDKKRERGNYVDWRHIVQIIGFSEHEPDVFIFDTGERKDDFKKISNVELPIWYNDDEKWKDELKNEHKRNVEDWEDSEELMGDLTLIRNVNGAAPMDFDRINDTFNSFETLCNCMDSVKSKDDLLLSNYVRLYRVLLGYPNTGHIDYCAWNIEGAWFSWRNLNSNAYFKPLSDADYLSLFSIRAEGLLKEIKTRVKGIVEKTDLFNLTASNFTASKHLKLWLLLKVLHAEKNNFLLNFYDGNGIATYTIAADNCLNEKLPFSIENSICGYAIKSPTNKVSYADGGNWKSENFDVLLLPDVITHEMFKNREKEPICEENINLLGNYIGELKKMLEDF